MVGPLVKYGVQVDAQETGSYQAGNEVAAQTGFHFPSRFSTETQGLRLLSTQAAVNGAATSLLKTLSVCDG